MSRDVQEWLTTFPFPSVDSYSHEASGFIPIRVALPEFIFIPSHSRFRLTNERHL